MKHSDYYAKWFRLMAMLLLSFLCGTEVYAQRDRVVSGIIVDENGEPLPGAHVKQVTQNEGESVTAVIVDMNGHFHISLPNTTKEIEVSYLGYQTERVKLTSASSYQVELTPSSKLLDEVVVTGYQTISKERATGSFAKVTSEDLQVKRLSNLSNLLAGEVAGYNDGLIRGTTTMNGTTTPLYVIDGFPVENTRMDYQGSLTEGLPDLNMEDIESITVLKDAAAASIYGARAANGVIVITTKRKSKANRTEVSVNASLTWQPYKYYTKNLANSELIIDLEKEWASSNPNLTGSNSADYAQNLLDNAIYPSAGIRSILNYYAGNISEGEMNTTLNTLSKKGYNYYDQMKKYAKRDPLYQQYNVSIAKTNDQNFFKASITYKYDRNEDKFANDQSLGIDITNTTQIAKWLSLDLGTYIKFSEDNEQGYDVLDPGYTFLPYDDLVNADGSHYTKPMDEYYTKYDLDTYDKYGLYSMDITPLDELDRQQQVTKEFSLRTYARLNFQILPCLKYSASFQYERVSNKYEQLQQKESASVRSTVNSFAVQDGDDSVEYMIPYGDIMNRRDEYVKTYNFRQQLDFDKTFNDVHSVTAIVGTETRENKIEMHKNMLFNYDTQLLTSSAVDAASLSSVVGVLGSAYMYSSTLASSYENVNRFVSVYGNAAYTYDGRYSVTGSLRWDRSNLWGTSSKYQNKPIWSVGASWIISKEKFFHADWVNFLKLRISEGIGGNISKDSAPYMVASYSTNYNVGGTYGYVSSRPNSQLSWEKTNTLNIGVDFSLFNNRLHGSIEYYDKEGRDLLANTMGVPTEGYGYSTYTINNGEMYNRGFEISLAGTILKNKNLSWTANATLGTNKNKVTYVNVEAPVYYLQLDYPSAYPVIGHEYNSIYGYRWAGLSEDGLAQVYDENGEKTTYQPTTLDAIVYCGTTTPKYNGSFGTTVSYRNFDFSIQFLFAGGHKMRNTNPATLNYSYSSIGYITDIAGASAAMANRWKEPGDEAYTDVPRAVFAESDLFSSDLYSVYYYSDKNILDASYIRVNNISLAYHLPKWLCKKCFLQSARIQANVENPFMWAKSRQAKYQLGGYDAANYVLGIYLNL